MFEFLFKYPPAVFADSELILANQWPLWLMLLLGLVCALLLGLSLLRQRSQLSGSQQAVVGVLQLLMVAVVLLVLWQPALVTERLVRGENTVALLLDTSASMAFGEGDGSRMQQARQLLDEESLRELRELYTLQSYGFAEQAAQLDSFALEDLPPPGETTDLPGSLLQTLRQSGNASLGAVIVISDGGDSNTGISQAQLNEIASYGVPIHSVGMGRETIPEDLELQEVSLPSRAPPGTTLSARLRIRHDQGGTARVKVYDGDTFLTTEEIPLNPQQRTSTAYIDIDASEPGQMDLRFTLDPLPAEQHLDNNSRSQVVDIPERRYRILYVEGEPRWEYKFMRRALTDDPSIRLTTLLRVSPNKYYRQGIEDPEELADGFPTQREDLYQYDALIIGSVEVAEFTEEQQAMVHDFVSERGGTLMMLAGLNGLGQGGWQESSVSQLLPARLTGDSEFVRQKAPVSLTESGQVSPLLQFSASNEENQELWAGLPAVADYQSIGPLRPAATTLLTVKPGEREQPLLVFQPYGRGQSYILATGGTWRWQMSLPLEDMRHETFWRQLARGLVANSPRPFELSTSQENERIRVRAEIRDPEAEANQNLQITAVASMPSNEPLTMELQPVAGKAGTYEASFVPPQEGLYTIEAISHRGDDPIDAFHTATRYEQDQEAFGIRQNRALLEQVATATGGQYWRPDQWEDITEAIQYSRAGITEREIRYLWDAPLVFLVLTLLKALEWTLRRRWRAI